MTEHIKDDFKYEIREGKIVLCRYTEDVITPEECESSIKNLTDFVSKVQTNLDGIDVEKEKLKEQFISQIAEGSKKMTMLSEALALVKKDTE